MDRGPVRAMAAAGALALAMTLVGAASAPPGEAAGPDRRSVPPDTPPEGTATFLGLPAATEYRCTVSEILEPSCGVWWGASPYENRVEQLEQAADRDMDIVYTWRGIDQADVPGRRERSMAAEGKFVHTNIEARRFTRPGHPAVSYASIADGEFDEQLRSQARGIAALDVPYFVTFDHEADANRRYNERGTPEEFVASWQHIVDLYRSEGADNAIWVWNVTGWEANLDRLPGLWPGNDYVDWISWEAYNMSTCDAQPNWTETHSFEEALRPAYDWIQTEGPAHGIDPDKPVMIGEMGTTDIGPRETLEWYSEIPDVLRRYERVRAVKMWDNELTPGCDFRIGANEYAQRGFQLAGQDPYVRLPERVRRLAEDAARRD
ncbi:glycoside hydrolase family 26 protein [Nocardiopsis sp. CA-288880]|uniref:glycoside hydrolase family 26 protein n=1 Tax=Nocardiopsis sp. CA-288880 TaxID=3239995 RepID=UPI003D951A6F